MAEPPGGVGDPAKVNWLGPGELSSLTTRELQQNLRLEKRRERPAQLLFEIPSSRIVHQSLGKHVVHDVVVMRSGSFDSRRVSVERRYSDFRQLHHKLQEEFQEELEEVQLPPKLLTGNFRPDSMSERRLALQDYLSQLYAMSCIRHSPLFAEFFTTQEQRKAHVLLRAGQFKAALELLQAVLEVQEKLLPWQKPTLLVPTLSALVVCYRDLDQPEEAICIANRALPIVRRYGLRAYRAALLELMVDLGYQLGRPVAQLQEELTVLRDSERGEVMQRSLKEVVIRNFI
uniref:Sorting nexin 20 n=1 Tax=Oryzias latipes TaxID=8090 RepID=A0A3P9K899_ORYLA